MNTDILIKKGYKLILNNSSIHVYSKQVNNLNVEITIEDETKDMPEYSYCHIDNIKGESLGDLIINNYDECDKFIKFMTDLIKDRNA